MQQPTLLVTGVQGFVGVHLARAASSSGFRVWGVGREREVSSSLASNMDRYFQRDLIHEWDIPRGVDAVVHLAGLSAVGPSFAAPQEYIASNSAIMTNLCEGISKSGDNPRVVVVSTGAVYDATAQEHITEDVPTKASSPYALSKLVVELQAAYYDSRGMDVVVARPFNHIGPGQESGFLVPDLTQAILHSRHDEPLIVGNLETRRDYTDVRDVVAAYLLLASARSHRWSTYNVASGVSRSGSEMLAEICRALGQAVPATRVDESRLRALDAANIVGNAGRLESEFGWRPTRDWHESIRDFVHERTMSSPRLGMVDDKERE